MSVDAGSVFMDVSFNVPKISKDLKRSVTDAADKAAPAMAKTFESRLAGFGATASKIGKQVTVGLSLPVAAGLAFATKGAAELEQAVGGTAAVFKDQQGKIEAFAKGAADSVGLSEKAARTFTTRMGAQLKGFGFSTEDAATKAIELTKTGADLAATFGGTTQEAVVALGAALRNEYDPLERFGIAINATLADQKAVEMGLAKSTSNVSQNARAQAALALITQRSADAQGQFGREASTAAGAAQIGAAKAENAADDLGKSFLPIYTKISQATGAVAQGFQHLPESTQTAIAGLGLAATAAGPLIFGLGQVVKGGVGIKKSLTEGSLAAGTAGRTLGALGLAVAGVGVAYEIWAAKMDSARQAASKIGESALGKAQGDSIGDAKNRLATINEQMRSIQSEIDNSSEIAFWDADFRGEMSALGAELQASGSKIGNWIGLAEQMAPATGRTADEMYKWVAAQGQAGRSFPTVAAAIKAYNEEQGKAGASTADTAEKMKKQVEDVEKVGDAFFGLIGSQKGYRDAVQGIADAQKKHQDSLRAVNDAQRGYGDAVRAVGDAQRGYQDSLQAITDAEARRQDALRGVEEAQLGVLDAQNRLNDAMRTSADDEISAERARIRLDQAKATLKKGGFDSKLDKQSAVLDVRQAQRDIERLDEERANRVTQAQADVIAAQEALVGANEDVGEATRGVDDAQRGAADSARAVGDAQRDASDAARAVRDAQVDATVAMGDITTATFEAADAAIELNKKNHEAVQLFRDTPGAIDPALEQLRIVRDLYPEMAGAIDVYIAKLQALRSESQPAVNVDAPGPDGVAVPRFGGGKAAGGSVFPGAVHQVNEGGVPEMFSAGNRQFLLPTAAGQVVPIDKVTAKAQGGVTNHFNMPNVNPRQLAAEVSYRQGRAVSGRTR